MAVPVEGATATSADVAEAAQVADGPYGYGYDDRRRHEEEERRRHEEERRREERRHREEEERRHRGYNRGY